MCIKHENFEFIVEALHKNSIIPTKKLSDICKSLCSDVENKSRMLRTCSECLSKKAFEVNPDDLSKAVTYYQWTRISEKKQIKNEEKTVNFLTKQQREGTINDLITEYYKQLNIFLLHEFNKIHQYKIITSIRDNLNENENFCRIDFSENVVCKYFKEVHGMHFGASKVQLSLHTGVKYSRDQDLKTQSFATVSKELEHGAPAIWAHMEPILSKINPEIHTLHIASDGPTAQYRNKHNFYLLTKLLPTMCPYIKSCTWNFTEAGHGKGPMDGVGGVLKRTADNKVAHGTDINSIEEFITVLEKSCPNINLTEVPTDRIEKLKPLCDKNKIQIPKVMQMHQAVWNKTTPNLIYIRSVSCMK